MSPWIVTLSYSHKSPPALGFTINITAHWCSLRTPPRAKPSLNFLLDLVPHHKPCSRTRQSWQTCLCLGEMPLGSRASARDAVSSRWCLMQGAGHHVKPEMAAPRGSVLLLVLKRLRGLHRIILGFPALFLRMKDLCEVTVRCGGKGKSPSERQGFWKSE